VGRAPHAQARIVAPYLHVRVHDLARAIGVRMIEMQADQ
jgi:hypothetical protein